MTLVTFGPWVHKSLDESFQPHTADSWVLVLISSLLGRTHAAKVSVIDLQGCKVINGEQAEERLWSQMRWQVLVTDKLDVLKVLALRADRQIKVGIVTTQRIAIAIPEQSYDAYGAVRCSIAHINHACKSSVHGVILLISCYGSRDFLCDLHLRLLMSQQTYFVATQSLADSHKFRSTIVRSARTFRKTTMSSKLLALPDELLIYISDLLPLASQISLQHICRHLSIAISLPSGKATGPTRCEGQEIHRCSEQNAASQPDKRHCYICLALQPTKRFRSDKVPICNWHDGWFLQATLPKHADRTTRSRLAKLPQTPERWVALRRTFCAHTRTVIGWLDEQCECPSDCEHFDVMCYARIPARRSTGLVLDLVDQGGRLEVSEKQNSYRGPERGTWRLPVVALKDAEHMSAGLLSKIGAAMASPEVLARGVAEQTKRMVFGLVERKSYYTT